MTIPRGEVGMWLKGREGGVGVMGRGASQRTADSHSPQMIWEVRSQDCPPSLETSSNGLQLTNRKSETSGGPLVKTLRSQCRA